MSIARLKAITAQIAQALSETVEQDPDQITGKMQELSALLGTSTEAVALAEMVYSQKIMELTEQYADKSLSATEKKLIITGKAKEEGYYVTLTERQNRALTHVLDSLRSQLSFLKQDQLNSKYQTT